MPSRTTTVGAPTVSSSPASASITSVNPAALSEILPGTKVVSAGIGSLKTLFVAVPVVVTSTVTMYVIGIAFLLFFTSANAISQEQGHLNVTSLVQMEEVSEGENGERLTRLVPVETVIPGDVVIYTTMIENISDQAADDIVVTSPVPEFPDVIDADAGELDTGGAPTVVVRLGNLTLADGIQTVVFQVTID